MKNLSALDSVYNLPEAKILLAQKKYSANDQDMISGTKLSPKHQSSLQLDFLNKTDDLYQNKMSLNIKALDLAYTQAIEKENDEVTSNKLNS